MKLLILAGLGVFLLTASTGYADSLGDANAGLDALNHGDNATAIRLFTRALRAGDLAASDRELALVERAKAYIGQNRNDLALADLEQARQLDPNDAEAAALRQQARNGSAEPSAAGGGPKSIGKFANWTAAMHQESGRTVCYAFTRVQTSRPSLPGRGAVVLTVTERSTGRDAVALEAGFAYSSGSIVTAHIGQAEIEFYTSGNNAFARNGQAMVAASLNGAQAVVQSPGPLSGSITDTFSLNGFAAAYGAINRACPPG